MIQIFAKNFVLIFSLFLLFISIIFGLVARFTRYKGALDYQLTFFITAIIMHYIFIGGIHV
jgi:hypothetical protein